MRRRDKEKGGSGTEIAPLPNRIHFIYLFTISSCYDLNYHKMEKIYPF